MKTDLIPESRTLTKNIKKNYFGRTNKNKPSTKKTPLLLYLKINTKEFFKNSDLKLIKEKEACKEKSKNWKTDLEENNFLIKKLFLNLNKLNLKKDKKNLKKEESLKALKSKRDYLKKAIEKMPKKTS